MHKTSDDPMPNYAIDASDALIAGRKLTRYNCPHCNRIQFEGVLAPGSIVQMACRIRLCRGSRKLPGPGRKNLFHAGGDESVKMLHVDELPLVRCPRCQERRGNFHQQPADQTDEGTIAFIGHLAAGSVLRMVCHKEDCTRRAVSNGLSRFIVFAAN